MLLWNKMGFLAHIFRTWLRAPNFALDVSGYHSSFRKVSNEWLVTLQGNNKTHNGNNAPNPNTISVTAANKQKNKPFPSCFDLWFKTSFDANLSNGNDIFMHFIVFHITELISEWKVVCLCSWTRFETEGKSNTEIAYWKLTRADTLLNFWQVSKPNKNCIFC